MLAAIIIGALGLAIAALFWYGLRGRSNEPPALGSNFPFPDGYLPGGPVISDDEEFRREADAHFAAEKRRRGGR